MPDWRKIAKTVAETLEEAAVDAQRQRRPPSQPNVCLYWDCEVPIRSDHSFCLEHYKDSKDGLINKCPSCGRFSPNPPKDTDGRREDSGRGWVRELQGRWPGVLG